MTWDTCIWGWFHKQTKNLSNIWACMSAAKYVEYQSEIEKDSFLWDSFHSTCMECVLHLPSHPLDLSLRIPKSARKLKSPPLSYRYSSPTTAKLLPFHPKSSIVIKLIVQCVMSALAIGKHCTTQRCLHIKINDVKFPIYLIIHSPK